MLTEVLLGAVAVCALWPALLFCLNLRRYQPPPPGRATGGGEAVAVLIPARNEEANIAAALGCVLASQGVELQVIVLDDDSKDSTGDLVRAFAAKDSRVQLLAGQGLPPGWNGKQHACWTLAQHSTAPLLVFLDADVRIEPELLARMAAYRRQTRTALVSGFPRLITLTWLEQLLLPLIHFVLLGFLPMGSMRRGTVPSVAAGCGQFLMVERKAYFASGGHNVIRETMHDGLLLPRALRRAGYRTDIADITELASVRMYDSAAKVWQGLAKNATEGIATAGKIVPLSLVLLFGQVLPMVLSIGVLCGSLFLVLYRGAMGREVPTNGTLAGRLFIPALVVLLAASYLPRLLAVRRFRQPLRSALLHPVGILVLLSVQWYALLRKVSGRPVGWRQRTYSSETGTQVS